MLAEMQGQCARVNAIDAGYAVRLQVVAKADLASPVAWACEIVHDKPRKEESARFDIFAVYAVVADLGCGERDELPGIARIRDDLLITAHAGVEHDLAQRIPPRPERHAVEHCAVRQRQKRTPLAFRLPLVLPVSTTVHCVSPDSSGLPAPKPFRRLRWDIHQ